MILLIKHSAPQIVAGVPPEDWVLSAVGRERCSALAERIAPFRPAAIFTSAEAKAMETGKLVAERLSLESKTAAGLQEHDRSNVPQMPSHRFISMMELAFRRPEELVLGRETVAGAGRRLDAAVRELLAEHPDQTLAVVTHGTVLAQWLAERTGAKPFALWRQMGLPSLVVLETPGMSVLETVDQIG